MECQCALAQYPYVQIADLRTESGPFGFNKEGAYLCVHDMFLALRRSATLQPQSMMWSQFQVDGINELYQGEVVEVERRFQNAIGIDEKKRLVRQLKPFQLLFGTSAVESSRKRKAYPAHRALEALRWCIWPCPTLAICPSGHEFLPISMQFPLNQ